MLITNNGTTVVPVDAGKEYVLSAAGGFGGGTLTPQWSDGANDVVVVGPSGPLALTAGAAYIITVPTSTLKLVLTGASGASITASIGVRYTCSYK
jgi:hypothetical protein